MQPKIKQVCQICGSESTQTAFNRENSNTQSPALTIKQCHNCGLFFNSPRLSEKELYNSYNNGYYFFQRRNQPEFSRIVAMYQRTVALVEDKVTEKRLLEIGSAKGYLLAILKDLGWDVFGIEISSKAAKYAREKFKVPCFTGTLEQFITTDQVEKYPLVLAIDLIEHVLDPAQFIEQIQQVISPGGYLIIDTPNGAAANIKTFGGDWGGFNPFHLFVFSPDNLSQLLEEFGFVVEKVFSYGNTIVAPKASRETAPRSLRSNIKAALKKTHLIDVAKEVRQGCWDFIDHTRQSKYLAETITEIQKATYNKSTPIEKAENNTNGQGDNLVVIARKR